MWDFYAPEPRMRLNLGIRRRLAPLLDNDRRKIELANSMLFTLPGSPVLYYGDEIGMGDNIWLPDRNGVRTPMQWDVSENGGFSQAAARQLYVPLIEGGEFDYRRVNVAQQENDPKSLLNWTRQALRIRSEHPAFGFGQPVYTAAAQSSHPRLPAQRGEREPAGGQQPIIQPPEHRPSVSWAKNGIHHRIVRQPTGRAYHLKPWSTRARALWDSAGTSVIRG